MGDGAETFHGITRWTTAARLKELAEWNARCGVGWNTSNAAGGLPSIGPPIPPGGFKAEEFVRTDGTRDVGVVWTDDLGQVDRALPSAPDRLVKEMYDRMFRAVERVHVLRGLVVELAVERRRDMDGDYLRCRCCRAEKRREDAPLPHGPDCPVARALKESEA